MKTLFEATGVVHHMTNDSEDCLCCEGKHVYCRYIQYAAESFDNGIRKVLNKVPKGSRLKLTIEIEEDIDE